MSLRYLRFRLFTGLLRLFSRRSRTRRMRAYAALIRLRNGMSVLDLGGQPSIWQCVLAQLDMTILNLPGAAERNGDRRIRYVEGDACRVAAFAPGQFDTVFSNSVIEHVGCAERRSEFAREVRRLGRSYWVQTPAKVVPDRGALRDTLLVVLPGQPPALLHRSLAQDAARLDRNGRANEARRALRAADAVPATILVETFCGIPKSYIAYFPGS